MANKYLDQAGLQHYTRLVQGMADGETLEYGKKQGSSDSTLHVRKGGIGIEELGFDLDAPGGLVSYESVESLAASIAEVSGDLATVLFELHLAQMGQLDLDTIAIFDFPDDVKEHQGQYESGGNKYYAAPGTGA